MISWKFQEPSVFGFTNDLVSYTKVSDTFPLSVLRVGIENILLSKISLEMDLAALFVPAWLITKTKFRYRLIDDFFGFF